mmetsp:Transcript_6455/g.9239  ORF Transcript_6455/g.9239 Transcript_6455/m.9239 type:complete len:176 (+) Transcript_6455:429-956(+)
MILRLWQQALFKSLVLMLTGELYCTTRKKGQTHNFTIGAVFGKVSFTSFMLLLLIRKSKKKGAVFIINFGRSRLKYFDRLYTKVATLQQVTGPVKVKAIHVQVGNWMLPPSFVMPVMLFAVPTSHRVRIKWYSSIEEIEKYGIFLSETLSSNSEILDDEVLERWLDAQAERERDT